MPVFPSNPLRTSPIHATLRKYPGLFGIPFLILMVGASFGLESFTQVRYDLHDQKVQNVRQFILSGKGGFITVIFIGEQRAGTWAGQEQEEIRYQGGVLRKFVPFFLFFFYRPTKRFSETECSS